MKCDVAGVASFRIRSVVAFMSISGQFEVDYRIICACRDGFVYTIKGYVA